MAYLLKGGVIATFVNKNSTPLVYKADVLVEGSIISRIAENIVAGPDVEAINCEGKWITPGMVDTHRHLFMTVLRGEQCDWLLSEYLVKMSWNIQTALTIDEVRIGQLAGCLDALHSGVTTICDHFHAALTPEHAEASLTATIQSGARVVWCPARQSAPTQIFPTIEYGNEEETCKWQMEKLLEWGSKDSGRLTPDGRVTLGLAYDLVGAGPMSAHQAALKYAREIPVAIITAHVVKEPRILKWRDGGLLGPDVIFSHCNSLYDRTDPEDEMWTAMKEYDCAIASTPVDELGMAHGNPVAMEAIQRGVKCGLGADGTSINGGDIFTAMRFALQFARGRGHEHIERNGHILPKYNKHKSADAFRLATLGGAEALNLSHLIGSIEVGKKADIVVFDADSANLAGIEDPIAGVTFHASNADVELVMVNGEIVKCDGKLMKVEWGPVARQLKEKANDVRLRFPKEKLEALWTKYYDASGAPRI
ncbi:Metallo-dependent hydrolase [Laetiporus sulphureus 93-53]|uniref:Metallo-dependent hydrolase n=1 Tax=Laetiporus sulphureus 93-53 TaxID=1314785 RepID=A0A165DSM7_9APHY|nr:Metallo-dependent hydrolase [Laetiporus sulphureus 93-53]KZT05548.1 Metallo-dependent hydrolase [Laetiporus sulphureus 93-53]